MQPVRCAVRLLYVEDEAMVRTPVIRTLRRLFGDLDIKVAESADEAIALLREGMTDHAYDVVLSDYNLLGGQTGGDILAWVKTHASYLEARFLFLSGNPVVYKLHPHVLDKPCTSAELRAAIETLLANPS